MSFSTDPEVLGEKVHAENELRFGYIEPQTRRSGHVNVDNLLSWFVVENNATGEFLLAKV